MSKKRKAREVSNKKVKKEKNLVKLLSFVQESHEVVDKKLSELSSICLMKEVKLK